GNTARRSGPILSLRRTTRRDRGRRRARRGGGARGGWAVLCAAGFSADFGKRLGSRRGGGSGQENRGSGGWGVGCRRRVGAGNGSVSSGRWSGTEFLGRAGGPMDLLHSRDPRFNPSEPFERVEIACRCGGGSGVHCKRIGRSRAQGSPQGPSGCS